MFDSNSRYLHLEIYSQIFLKANSFNNGYAVVIDAEISQTARNLNMCTKINDQIIRNFGRAAKFRRKFECFTYILRKIDYTVFTLCGYKKNRYFNAHMVFKYSYKSLDI